MKITTKTKIKFKSGQEIELNDEETAELKEHFNEIQIVTLQQEYTSPFQPILYPLWEPQYPTWVVTCALPSETVSA